MSECGCAKKLHADDGLWWCKHGPEAGFAQINLSSRPGAPGSRSLADLARERTEAASSEGAGDE